MTTDTSLRLGLSWDDSEHLFNQALWFVPRIGEAIELLEGVEGGTMAGVLDVKHCLIDGLQVVEALIYPRAACPAAIRERFGW